jgi:hypothetical protein
MRGDCAAHVYTGWVYQPIEAIVIVQIPYLVLPLQALNRLLVNRLKCSELGREEE